MYSTTPPESKDPFQLYTFVTEANVRFYLPYDILLTNKNRFDWRIKDGHFEPRYRPRLTFEKEFRTRYMYLTPDIYGEYYVYFNGEKLNRFRLSAGIQTKVTSHIDFKTYYVHQFGNGDVSSLDALGLEVKFYLNHKEIKKNFHVGKKHKGLKNESKDCSSRTINLDAIFSLIP